MLVQLFCLMLGHSWSFERKSFYHPIPQSHYKVWCRRPPKKDIRSCQNSASVNQKGQQWFQVDQLPPVEAPNLKGSNGSWGSSPPGITGVCAWGDLKRLYHCPNSQRIWIFTTRVQDKEGGLEEGEIKQDQVLRLIRLWGRGPRGISGEFDLGLRVSLTSWLHKG